MSRTFPIVGPAWVPCLPALQHNTFCSTGWCSCKRAGHSAAQCPPYQLFLTPLRGFTHCCHQVFDGWGSYLQELQASPVFQGVFKVARKFYALFQLHTTPERAVFDNQVIEFSGTVLVFWCCVLVQGEAVVHTSAFVSNKAQHACTDRTKCATEFHHPVPVCVACRCLARGMRGTGWGAWGLTWRWWRWTRGRSAPPPRSSLTRPGPCACIASLSADG